MSRATKATHVCQCHPQMLTVWSTKELQAWYDYHGAFMTYSGKLWEPHHQRVAPGRHRVRMKEYSP